jgi:hypothetical protein
MKSHLEVMRMFLVVVCLGVLSLSGCADFVKPEIGAVARKEARIPLAENGVKDTILETGDVIITASLTGAGERVTLSGFLVFDQSVTYTFPVIMRFRLKMSFLDGDGRVIETRDITPVFSTFGMAPEKLHFRVSRVPPPGSKAIAFSYFGSFRDRRSESSGSWDIHYFPFD